MDSIVLELQKEAYDSKSGVTDLLRKAYVVAKKLKIKEFEEWLHNELNGYQCPLDRVPEYRTIVGDMKAWNPYNGWIPVIIPDDEITNLISKSKISQSIPEIDKLLKSESNYLVLKLPASMENLLGNFMEFTTKYQLHFSKSQANHILETVRNIVLEWALKLEEDGILGNNISFSKEEQQKAQKENYNVYNFYGEISNSQIQQNTVNSTQTMRFENIDIKRIKDLVELLKGNIDNLELDETKREIVESEVMTINAQVKSPKTNSLIICESLKTIRNVLEGATGSLIASGLLYQISQVLAK